MKRKQKKNKKPVVQHFFLFATYNVRSRFRDVKSWLWYTEGFV